MAEVVDLQFFETILGCCQLSRIRPDYGDNPFVTCATWLIRLATVAYDRVFLSNSWQRFFLYKGFFLGI